MSKLYAVRNISLCTKDCLCLYVCPTGATDTEDSIIDKSKCIGCGACANACPSKAISMVPTQYPPQQKHDDEVIKAMRLLLAGKMELENMAAALPNKLAKAVEKSNRIMAEDILRESGFMLPQSANTNAVLKKMAADVEAKVLADELLATLDLNEEAIEVAEPKTEKWQCSICKHIHEGPLTDDFVCPICKQPASVFVKLED